MKYLKIIIAVVLTLAIGGASGIVTADAIATWYIHLNKPFFNPPNWVFGPAWTMLYILMGISAGLIWNEGFHKKEVKIALSTYAFQMILNALWSVLFFYFKSPLFALFDILLLIFAIILCMYFFYPVKKIAAYLLTPYLIWVIFASILNLSILLMN
jgi:translocator protein